MPPPDQRFATQWAKILFELRLKVKLTFVDGKVVSFRSVKIKINHYRLISKKKSKSFSLLFLHFFETVNNNWVDCWVQLSQFWNKDGLYHKKNGCHRRVRFKITIFCFVLIFDSSRHVAGTSWVSEIQLLTKQSLKKFNENVTLDF